MKNIIILGVPRAGKTTLVKMIKEKYPKYNLIQEDIINESLRRIIEKTSNKSDWAASFESSKILDDKILNFLDISMLFEPSLNYILDTVTTKPKTCKEFQKKGVIVIALGYPNENISSVLKRIRYYENESDWTKVNSNLIMCRYIDAWINDSKYLEKETKKYSLKFIDTGKNRQKALNEAMEWLEKKLNENKKESMEV